MMSLREKMGLAAAIISVVSSALTAIGAIILLSFTGVIFEQILLTQGYFEAVAIRGLLVTAGVMLLLFSLPIIVIGAIFCAKRKNTGLAITLLVLNCLWMNVLAIGFLIAYLCIRDAPALLRAGYLWPTATRSGCRNWFTVYQHGCSF